MKKVILIMLVIAGCISYKPATAQVSVNINIGSQPVWGPVGYDYVEYYYLPDIDAYYYVPTRQFIYLSGNRWMFSTTLPARYRSYNIYTGYKVVINEPRPYLHYTSHRTMYAKYKGGNGRQVIIKNSNDPKYYVVKGHPKYKTAGNKTIVRSKSNNQGGVKKDNGQRSVAKGKGNNGKGRN